MALAILLFVFFRGSGDDRPVHLPTTKWVQWFYKTDDKK
jgi:hypothetical protein